MPDRARVAAVLGPTNTGKTHYAIDRMLGYRTGMIGLPLRLLAREVYDKIVAARGPSVVALVTGEERIVPKRATYWVCTVEADAPIGEVAPEGCIKPPLTGAGGSVLPPFQAAPTFAGGRNSMLATCTGWGAPKAGGMG